jgi:hypothetical protein
MAFMTVMLFICVISMILTISMIFHAIDDIHDIHDVHDNLIITIFVTSVIRKSVMSILSVSSEVSLVLCFPRCL